MVKYFKGSCLCGNITYECNAEPVVKAVCHCTDCQKHTSSAFSIVIGVPKSNFILQGDSIKNIPITTDSGNTKRYSFAVIVEVIFLVTLNMKIIMKLPS